MDLSELEKLIELMNSNDLVEVEIETDESRVRLRKKGDVAAAVMPAPAPLAPAAPIAGVAAGAPGPAADTSSEGDSVTFNSPMVGTFYTAASPGSEPFVRVGSKVGASTVLCIIEAMKVMNEITADMEGEILETLVGNGEAVEYGQPLFTLKPR